jgi:hypothetical protein
MNLAVTHHARGAGLIEWEELGRYDLAATAVLRNRCCPSAKPAEAATPKGVCESLQSAVGALGREPAPERVDEYARGVDCFMFHGVRYPTETWDRMGPTTARSSFDRFLARPPR